MKKGKITPEIHKKMVDMRKGGATYKEIEKSLGIGRWSCLNYLKNVSVDESFIKKEWKKAEEEAIDFLQKKGFGDIHNLNRLCPSPHWDVLARKDKQWWLVDVTISSGKTIGAKIPFTVKEYQHSILYKNIENGEWKLIKVSFEDFD